MKCNCLNICRDPVSEGSQERSLKLSKHHPSCKEYKLEEFYSFDVEGSRVLVESCDGFEGCTPEVVYMTRDQFEAIPEF